MSRFLLVDDYLKSHNFLDSIEVQGAGLLLILLETFQTGKTGYIDGVSHGSVPLEGF
jgi:hypothetical protein